MDECLKRFYEFGPFQLDAEERLLLRDGEAVGLTPKAFDLLLAMVERPGRLLGKEELLQAVWPGAVVEENNLADNISKLRKALGEGDNGQRFIETVPKRGYRFVALVVAPVEELNNGSVERVVAEHPHTRIAIAAEQEIDIDDRPGAPNPVGPKRWREVLTSWRLLALVALIIAGCVFWVVRTARQPAVSVRSIAVLPFMPLSANDRDEAMELGMADTLISKLSGLRQVTVRPINSVRKYQNLEQDPIAAGRELGVDAVLTGAYQRRGEMIRVTARLLRVSDGWSLWSDKFEGIGDPFALQDALSEQVALALVPQLTGEERKLLAQRNTNDPEAYRLYTMGRYFWNKRTPEGFNRAIEFFQQAIARDRNFAAAYAGLADCYMLLSGYDVLPATEVYPKAKDALLEALALDPALIEAQVSLAAIKASYEWDWRGAGQDFRRAIALNPNYATAHQWYAEYLAGMGRPAEALAHIHKAQELDPTSLIIRSVEAFVLYYAHDYDRMLEQCRKVIAMDQYFGEIYSYIALAYEQKGMYREAMDGLQKRATLMGIDTPAEASIRAAPVLNHTDYWRKRLALEKARPSAGSTFNTAEAWAQLGDTDKAIALLEKVWADRSYQMMYLKVNPNLDRLHSDPRFAELLRRMKLAP